jgi:hypothetical protein
MVHGTRLARIPHGSRDADHADFLMVHLDADHADPYLVVGDRIRVIRVP